MAITLSEVKFTLDNPIKKQDIGRIIRDLIATFPAHAGMNRKRLKRG